MFKRMGSDAILKCKFNLKIGPSDRWFQQFEARHRELKNVVPQTLDKCRINQASDWTMDEYFNKLGIY